MMLCQPCWDEHNKDAPDHTEVRVDVEAEFDGSMFALSLNTDAVREWVDEYVYTEGWQWLGSRLIVDKHVGEWFIGQLAHEGFKVEVK